MGALSSQDVAVILFITRMPICGAHRSFFIYVSGIVFKNSLLSEGDPKDFVFSLTYENRNAGKGFSMILYFISLKTSTHLDFFRQSIPFGPIFLPCFKNFHIVPPHAK